MLGIRTYLEFTPFQVGRHDEHELEATASNVFLSLVRLVEFMYIEELYTQLCLQGGRRFE
jgi:hypothetical protein